MGLLNDLKAAAPVNMGENQWNLLRRVMPVLVPDFEMSKLDVFNNGRIGLRAKSPMQGAGRYYVVLVLEPVGTGRDDGTRQVLLGVDRYRDEADAMVYSKPYSAWLDPKPGAVAAWLAGVLLTQDPYSGARLKH